MYRYVDFHFNWLLLNITIPPPQSEATSTTTNVTERGIIMKIISINEENKGKERSNNLYYNKQTLIITLFNTEIQVEVDKRITLAQLKEELVPLIGVPSTGFRVYGIRYYNKEYEMEGLDETLKDTKSGSEVV